MPSATNGNKTVNSNQLSGSQSEAMKQVLSVIEKKVRNMEKKKSKLDDYQARNNKGERLNQDQLEALSKYQEVINNLEFARELHKSFLALSQDIQKAEKKAARREQLLREEAEQVMLRKVLELQFILDRLGDEGVRQELVQVTSVPALLTETDLVALDDFYKLVGPERDQTIRLTDQYQEASQHLWDLLEGKDKAVAGTTYKALREILEHVLQSGYFDQVQSHQNGVCTEEEEKQTAVAESSEADEQQADTEGEMTERYAEPILMEATEFVNRQFIPETSYSNGEKEQGDKWSAEIEVPSSLQQPDQMTPVIPEPHAETSVTPTPSSDPLVRKQVVQDLMAQMQGPYNFMQDSMLEFDAQPIDPAIVSAQPMKPTKSMEMPQMVFHPESCLAPSPTIPVPIVPPAPEAYSTPPPMFQPTLPAEPRPQADSIDPIQASMSLVEQPPPSAALSGPSQNAQVFQPSSKPIHSSGINVNAAPFQSMQTVIELAGSGLLTNLNSISWIFFSPQVFNLNAPVPPANEADSLKQSSQYTGSYSQSFSSQTQHPVEQTDMQSEQLQAVVGAFQDQSLPSSTGQQSLSQQPAGQGSAFGRQTQSFYNSRALPRGGPRNSRGMINGYRGPSNGFRGSYDGYRPNFSGAPNSGYGQAQFNTARDYSNSNYQRDGYQQNYKRATGQGPRGVPRGNGQAMRS
uniref:Caprin-1 dimerization domain-containing protein n=1 Tax=Electrophorus electricus TaxID=8005 RepID=A0A4W4FCT3_ELEEL